MNRRDFLRKAGQVAAGVAVVPYVTVKAAEIERTLKWPETGITWIDANGSGDAVTVGDEMNNAYAIQYRHEFIAQFEQRQLLMRKVLRNDTQ